MANWFVRNARDGRWLANELGSFCNFEDDDARFTELGINLNGRRARPADVHVPP